MRATIRLIPRRGDRRRRLGPVLIASIALHLAVLAVLLLRPAAAPVTQQSPAPANYAVVFNGGRSQPRVPVPAPGPARAKPSPPLAAAPAPRTQPAPARTPPVQPPQPPTPQAAQPAPREVPPPLPIPPAPQASPSQTPPLPATRTAPSPRPEPSRTAHRAAPPRPQSSSTFPAPMNFSFGAPARLPSRRQGLSNAPVFGPNPPSNAEVAASTGGASALSDFRHVSGADPGPDWFDALQRYWIEHRYYPRQAAERNQGGTAVVRIHVDKYGVVHEVELMSDSGSIWLDAAAQSWLRDAHLAPFPPGTRGGNIAVIDLRIIYHIIGG